jgi:hypothetical protein
MLTRLNPHDFRLMQATLASLIAAAALAASASPARAVTPAPAWQIRTLTGPTNISPTKGVELTEGGRVTVLASDVGGQPTDGSTVTVTDTLPAGVTPVIATIIETLAGTEETECPIVGQTVTCTDTTLLGALNQGQLRVRIKVSVTPGTSGTLPNTATVCSESGVPACASADEPITVSAQEPPFGLADFSTYDANAAGAQDTQAGDHPSALVTTFDINTAFSGVGENLGEVFGVEDLKDVVVDLPVGLVGDPQATPKCPEYDLTGNEAFRCPADTVIGTIVLKTNTEAFATSGPEGDPSPIVNVQPEKGYPAQFGFTVGSNSVMMYAKVVWTSAGYVLRVAAPGITRFIRGTGAKLTFFGDPRAQRPFGNPPGTPAAFFTNPVDCSAPQFTTTIHVDSWQNPAPVPLNPDGSANFTAVNFNDTQWKNATALSPPVTGCDELQFNPALSFVPETEHRLADEPAGYEAVLRVPQNEDPNGLATPPLKNAVVTLPAGVSISPSAADGLVGCLETGSEGIELESVAPGRCPAKSKVGEAEVLTPLLTEPLKGSVYVAQPSCGGPGQPGCTEEAAETGGVFALYLEVGSETSGVHIKLKGKVEVGGNGKRNGLQPGQIRTTFAEGPQQPFSELKLKFNGGPRAPLANPQTCGAFTTMSALTPWSSTTEAATQPSQPFTISGCVNRFAPGFTAGTVNPQAGAFSPFTLTFSRHDREQNLSGITVNMPPGLLGRIAGIPQCGEADASAGTCAAASQIGTATAAAGSGSHPFWQSGPVYLTGPYRGAPFGLSVAVPAKAGPYNLGTIVVRAAIYVDPNTAALTVVSDPLPQSVDGVPLRLQTVNVTVDREGFMFNPTSCEPTGVAAAITSAQGAQAPVASRFQAANCQALPFKPVFTASTLGHTSKQNGASLHVGITSAGVGQANIHKVELEIPKILPSRLTTLQKACTEAQFNTNPAGCPSASDIATAVVHTPLLNSPLAGPVYFVSHGGAAFPDTEIILQGEGVTLILDGHTDIKKGVTYSRFETVPDAPFTSFEFNAPEGPYSIFAAYGNLCTQSLVMPVTLTAQSGAVLKQNTHVEVTGCAQKIAISKRKLTGNSVSVTVSTTAKGLVTITGAGLRKTSKTFDVGSHTIRLPLTAKGRSARKHRRKISIHASLKVGKKTVAAKPASLTL